MKGFVRVFVVLLMTMFITVCGKAPTAPSQAKGPVPLAGTTVMEFAVPDSPDPMKVWITNMAPVVNGKLVPGQTASITYTCSGSSAIGKQAWIGAAFMSGDYLVGFTGGKAPAPLDMCVFGGSNDTSCGGGSTSSMYINISDQTPNIDHVLFQVWLNVGPNPPKQLCPSATFEQKVNLTR